MWKDNFLWFQEMFKKYDIPWSAIYLLEIRNAEWGKQSILHFQEFIDFLIKWIFYNPCNGNTNKFINFLLRGGYNILRSPLTTIGRGLGCSIQSTFTIRLGDLAVVPCHRLSYDTFIYGYMTTDNGKITGIKAHNPELMVAITSLDGKNMPMCQSCLIKDLCSLGCLGSQFEITGDMFSPIPTVCQLEHAKLAAMVRSYSEIGMFDLICDRIKVEKADALRYIKEVVK